MRREYFCVGDFEFSGISTVVIVTLGLGCFRVSGFSSMEIKFQSKPSDKHGLVREQPQVPMGPNVQVYSAGLLLEPSCS